MKYVIIFFSFLICSFNSNSQTIKKSDLLGKWYQCEESDGKVIKLFKEKCYSESLNKDSTKGAFNLSQSTEWNFKRLGQYSVENYANDSLSRKGKMTFSKSSIQLDGITYFITNSHFSFWDEGAYGMTLVREDYYEMYKTIQFQIERLDLLLSLDWIITPIDSGFSVYYTNEVSRRSQYEKRIKEFEIKQDIELAEVGSDNYRRSFYPYGIKVDFSPDSVSWRCYLSLAYRYGVPTNEELRNDYPKNGILKIDVKFSDKWTQSHVKLVQSKNDKLKKEILKEPLYKSNESIFNDYRSWTPLKTYWGDRTNKYDYWFERLPYKSKTMNYSIFIHPNTPSCGEPVFVDDNDSLFFDNKNNFLEEERKRTMRIIALSLGINDY